MKRSGPLQRRKPLQSHSSLRRAAIQRKPAAADPKPRRRSNTGPKRTVAQLVDERAGGWCEWPGCHRRGTDRHHRLNRKAGGRHGAMRELLNGSAWLLRCCRTHHDYATSPHGAALAECRAKGWLLQEGQDARLVPVLTRHWPAPILLDEAGQWSVDA